MGRGVAAAVLSESRLTLSDMDVPLLFVDMGIFVVLACPGAGTELLLSSMADMRIVTSRRCSQQRTGISLSSLHCECAKGKIQLCPRSRIAPISALDHRAEYILLQRAQEHRKLVIFQIYKIFLTP